MPRTARKKSETGVYHIVWRGNNTDTIFFDDEDYRIFQKVLYDEKKRSGFILYAWCLMPNHIHILLREGNTPTGEIFRAIGTVFVSWYNRKYDRIGHLFQGRYWSEPVEDTAYFLKAVRYIHLNPVLAGICDDPDSFPYCSYRQYINRKSFFGEKLIFGLLTREEFITFHQEKTIEKCLDIEDTIKNKPGDEEVCRIISQHIGSCPPESVKDLPRKQRTEIIQDLLDSGASYRQINRLTAVSLSVIRAISHHMQ